MKPHSHQSATSLPRAPHDDANARMTKYFVMMSIRVVCFILMVVVTPYGWYTWVFAAGAAFLPYFAVVVANVSSNARDARAIPPERALPAAPDAPAAASSPSTGVLRIHETSPEQDTEPAPGYATPPADER